MEIKEKRLMELANCEVCHREEVRDLINIGLYIGYEVGNYGISKIDYKVKPKFVGICSIHLCYDCKRKIMEAKMFSVNVLPKLKELIKGDILKQMIVEALQKEVKIKMSLLCNICHNSITKKEDRKYDKECKECFEAGMKDLEELECVE